MKKLMVSLAVLLVATGAFAQSFKMGQIYQAEDTSPVLWVHNKGTEKVTFYCYSDSSTTNKATVGSVSTTLNMNTADTIATLAAALETVTNSAGEYVLDVDMDSIVSSSESVDDECLIGNNSINAGDWGAAFIWDTSDTKHFRVYYPPANKGAPRKAGIAKSAKISAGGTGDMTVSAYLNGSEVMQFVSPSVITYGGTPVTNQIMCANMELPLDILVGSDKGLTLSADRATTGTTGGVLLRITE